MILNINSTPDIDLPFIQFHFYLIRSDHYSLVSSEVQRKRHTSCIIFEAFHLQMINDKTR